MPTSPARLRPSIHSRSSANFRAGVIAFRPFTWAQPVIPGRTDWRRRRTAGSFGCSISSSGRGPISAMSPRMTFQSSGSSSRLDRRRTAPTGGVRSAPGVPGGASCMVRNFTIRNGRPSRPTRSCRNRTGPPTPIATRSATAAIRGASTTDRISASVRSVARRAIAVVLPATAGVRPGPHRVSRTGFTDPERREGVWRRPASKAPGTRPPGAPPWRAPSRPSRPRRRRPCPRHSRRSRSSRS